MAPEILKNIVTPVHMAAPLLINCLTQAKHSLERSKNRTTNPMIQEIHENEIRQIEQALIDLRKRVASTTV